MALSADEASSAISVAERMHLLISLEMSLRGIRSSNIPERESREFSISSEDLSEAP